MLYPFTWNDVDTAKGYQVKITISSKKNKKIKKTFVEKTKKVTFQVMVNLTEKWASL